MKTNHSLPAATVLGVLAALQGAAAQGQVNTPNVSQNEELTEIVVTGSRIRGVATVGASVVALDRDVMERSGATSTAELLKEVPQITALGINAEGSLGAGAPSNITRATAPNLRGLGTTATLTMLDGRRVSASGTMGQYVDPSVLPLLAVERVEVIADGASAIYGSDAVAGVVNIIPRKRFQGVEVAARGGFGDDYSDHRIGAIAGFDWTGGNITIAVDRTHNDELDVADRSFLTNDRRSFGGANGLELTCTSPGTMTIGNVNYALPGGSGTSLNVADLTPNTSNPCDAIKLDRLLPEDTRHSAYLNLQQELTDSLSFYVQGLYSKREFSTFRSHPVLNIANVPVTNPFRPADVPAATAIRVQTSLVPDVGRGRSSGTAKNYDVAAGLEWKVGDFRVRATGSHGEGEDEEIRILVDTYQLNQALADPNPATAFNPFAGPGFNNPATLAKIFSDRAVIAGTSTITAYDVDVDGPLFALPGGQVRIAAGAEYREEGLDTYTVRAVAATGLPGVTIQDNDRNIRAVFGELYVPVVGAANAVPGIQALNLSLAVRYEDYSDFGSTTNPKVGLSWETGGGVTLRGSYGTSFRAPGLSENDPLSGGNLLQGPTRTTLANGQVIYTVTFGGGRADLKPEEATTWTAGFDFEPESLSNFKLGVTYFDVEYKNQIVDGVGRGALYYNNPAAFPEQVGFQGTPQFDVLRGVIERFGYTPTAPIDYSQPDLVLVDLRRANVGSVKANGLDLTARYSLDLASAGQLSFGLFATRFLDYTTRDGRQPEVRRLNRISYPAKFAGRALVGWDRAGVETQLAINYTNSYLNDLSLLVPTVDSYTTVDLDVGYRFDEGFLRDSRIAVNVRNLFDEEPPRVDRASAYDPSKASAVGRVISLSVSKRW